MGFGDDFFVLLQNQIGQIMTIIVSIITGLKYLDHRQNAKINDAVKDQISELKNEVRLELLSLRNCVESMQKVFDAQINGINRIIDRWDKDDR